VVYYGAVKRPFTRATENGKLAADYVPKFLQIVSISPCATPFYCTAAALIVILFLLLFHVKSSWRCV